MCAVNFQTLLVFVHSASSISDWAYCCGPSSNWSYLPVSPVSQQSQYPSWPLQPDRKINTSVRTALKINCIELLPNSDLDSIRGIHPAAWLLYWTEPHAECMCRALPPIRPFRLHKISQCKTLAWTDPSCSGRRSLVRIDAAWLFVCPEWRSSTATQCATGCPCGSMWPDRIHGSHSFAVSRDDIWLCDRTTGKIQNFYFIFLLIDCQSAWSDDLQTSTPSTRIECTKW